MAPLKDGIVKGRDSAATANEVHAARSAGRLCRIVTTVPCGRVTSS